MSSQASPNPRPTRLMQAALDAAAAGLYVFPVWPKGKLPAVKDWENAATRAPDTITNWWTARPWNVGIAVGRSRVVVIDLDQGRGQEAPEEWAGASGGREVLRRLATASGEPDPTATYTVTTPTDGEHLYYLMPDGLELRNTQSGLGWKIDTRGHGGFVVGAGSVRAEGMYRVCRHGKVAPLPAWLATALTPPPPPPPAEPMQLSRIRAGACVRAIIEREAADLAAAQPGSRHKARLKAARTLGRLVGGGELEEQTARQILLDAAAGHLGPDTTEREVVRDIDDGIAFGRKAPRSIRRGRERGTSGCP
jgi:hypothetical protein